MIEYRASLKSNHAYNFRHGQENPVIIDVVYSIQRSKKHTMDSEPKLCYKVKYSDGYVNLVPVKEVESGIWITEIME